jgi:hypothetical protein
LESSILRLKKIGYLKSGDTDALQALVVESPGIIDRTFLHTAVQIASLGTIDWLVKSSPYNIDVNATDQHGNTPLHLAALYGRLDVALLLLSLPYINDTTTNSAGKQPVELSKTPHIAEAMQIARARYVESIATLMRKYLTEENIDALDELLAAPRASALLDINGQDPDTGSTVLHDFVRQKNKKMVEFVLGHGGDPFRRDIRGVLPVDIAKDDSIKKLLKGAAKDQSVIGSKEGKPASGPYGEPPSMKGYLKKWTNFTGGYKLRWFVLENGTLSYYKRQDDTDRACRGSINLKQARLHLDSSEKLRFEISMKGSNSKFHLKANHPVETNRWVWAVTNAIQHAKDHEKSKLTTFSSRSASSSLLRPGSVTSGNSSSERFVNHKVSKGVGLTEEEAAAAFIENDLAREDEEVELDDLDEDYDEEEEDESEEPDSGRLPSALFEETITLEVNAIKDVLKLIGAGQLKLADLQEATSTIFTSLDAVDSVTKQYVRQSTTQERSLTNRIERAENKERLWVQNLRDLELEHEKIQGDLYVALRRGKEATRMLREANLSPTPEIVETGPLRAYQELPEESDDEFFEAMEGLEPQKTEPVKMEAEEEDHLTVAQKTKRKKILAEHSFAGYDDAPRKRLTMDDDNRPKIGLWGILKNLIGKDMTRMTLPVSFNECTNLLQRSAEDMEYTDLLDQAARAIDDPGLRLAYVAAFAASSYSSTINRIAKPFNPLLGETFEYSRPDCGYRLFAEQVSHHPPVGAMICESAKWDFYGDSYVKSKFNGRSFDINPLGRWYVVLRPDKGADVEEELYSFRKVTSSVVGIITGSPVVDNYGEMEITNHSLDYKCILTFKPRGWRGNNAYEVKGDVMNPDGKAEWVVGGRWNDKILAKRVVREEDDEKDESSLLLWQVHERPKAPFNLTPFAITLNALPDSLKPWVAPTDTRLRPDQRAMEDGRYDDASNDKHRVEEKQRAARREREENGVEYNPVWFKKSQHPVTGDVFYEPVRNYWDMRKNRALEEVSLDIF